MTLDEFMDIPEEPAPRVQKKRPVAAMRGGATSRTAGHYGPCPERSARAYVTKRHSERHRFHYLGDDDGAWAISDDVLAYCANVGVSVVLIHAVDTQSVYEYTLRDFTHDGRQVPERFLQRTDDPQTYRAVGDATVWPDHGLDLYIPRGESIPEPEAEFSRGGR